MPPPLPPGATYEPPPDAASSQGSTTTPPLPKGATYDQPDPGFWSTLGRHISHGMMNLVYGGAQVGAGMGPEIGDPYTTPEQSQALTERVDKATRKRAKQISEEPGTREHPVAAALGDISGEMAATAPLFALPGALPTWGTRALGMAIPGALTGSMQPATSQDPGSEKVEETIGGAVAATLTQPFGELAGKGLSYGYRAGRRALLGESEVVRQAGQRAAATTERAQQLVQGKFKQGGAIATDIMQQMQEARAAGQPYTLLDVGNEQVERLAGTLYRSQTGEQGQALKEFQQGRISARDPETLGTTQYTRLREGLRRIFGNRSATAATEQVVKQRAETGQPLWDKAMEGGGVASLREQLGTAFNEADAAISAANQRVQQANAKLTALRGRQATALGTRDPRQATGGFSILGAPHPAVEGEEAAAANELTQAQNELRIAQQNKEAVRSGLQRAQQDGTANLRGAVWSPHLQRILERPEVKQGLYLGERIAANEAAAKNTAFNPHDYAIVGHDANGDPIIGAVPNMRLLQMAKQGLDAMLAGEPVRAGSTGEAGPMRNPLTRQLTKLGRSVNEMRQALLRIGDALNPDWKAAREHWAGETATLEALKDGQTAFRGWTLEDFRTRWSEMTGAEREFFKLGIADHLAQDLESATDAGFENKAMIKTPKVRNMLYAMFRDSPGDADRFINFIEREREMYRVGGRVMKGSPTAGREAADVQNQPTLQQNAEAAHHGLRALLHFKTGNIPGFVMSGLQARRALGWTGQDPVFNEELMRMLIDPNIQLSQGPGGRLRIGPQAPKADPRGTVRRYGGAYATGLPAQFFTTGVEEIFGQ